MKSGIPGAALVFVGLIVVGVGLFVAGSATVIGLGVLCLLAAGGFEVAAQRQKP